MRLDQQFDFSLYAFVACAGFGQKESTRFGWLGQRGVKELIDLLPAFACHRSRDEGSRDDRARAVLFIPHLFVFCDRAFTTQSLIGCSPLSGRLYTFD